MADKVEKPKKSKAKPKKDEKGVLAALPSTRPERIGTRRGGRAEDVREAGRRRQAATASAKPAKRAAGDEDRRQARDRHAPQGRRSAHVRADRRPPRAPPARPTSAPPASPRRRAPAPEPRPRPVREGAPGMGTTSPDRGDERSEAESAESGRPSGVELVTTAVQAAGELTQIGLTIGGRIVKRAVDRLPKP